MSDEFCPGCLDAFSDADGNPAGLLPCFHPICQRCIDKERTGPGQCQFLVQGEIYCHATYERHEMVSGRTLAAEAAASPSSAAAQRQQLCECCGDEQQQPTTTPASHRCDACAMCLCPSCVAIHAKLPATKTHQLTLLPPLPPPPSPSLAIPVCATHSARPASLFCDTCSQLICGECLVAQHAGHSLYPVGMGLAKYDERAKSLLHTVLAKRDACVQGLELVNADLEQLGRHRDASLQEIADTFDRIEQPVESFLAHVRARRATVVRDATTAIDADYKALEAQRDQLIVFKDHVDRAEAVSSSSSSSSGKGTSNKPTVSMATSRLGTLNAKAIKTTPGVETTRSFVHSKTTVAKLTALFASATGDMEHFGTLRTTPLHPISRDYTSIQGHVRTIGSKGDGELEFNRTQDLSFDLDGNLLVADRDNKRVQIVSQDGRCMRIVKVEDSFSSAVASASGDVWIPFGNKCRVQLFSAATGAVLHTIEGPNANASYMDCLEDGSLVLSHTNEDRITLCDPDGAVRWVSRGEGFNTPSGIVTVPEHKVIAVCDYGNHRVQLLSLASGEFVRSFGDVGQMTWPSSIDYDPVLEVFVVGEDGKLSVWSLDGHLVHRFGNSISAEGVAISPTDGSIYVSYNNGNRILVF